MPLGPLFLYGLSIFNYFAFTTRLNHDSFCYYNILEDITTNVLEYSNMIIQVS